MHDFEAFLAPAKINLFLHITGQRVDGYHLLQTVFRLLDYYDTIYLKTTNTNTIKRVNDVAGVPEANDLCVRAARLLQKHTGCQLGTEILVDKKIPMGGGLGGGSSDAATVLLALNQRWKLNLPREELLKLGLQLGADVPFFIYGSNAWAEGVGEQLQAISLNNAYYVVLTPNVHVSTAQIFSNNQLTKNAIPKKIAAFSEIAKLSTVNSALGNIHVGFTNQLEKVVCSIYPEVKACLGWLKQYGDARMSGSGASVFLEVTDQETANSIYQQKPKEYFGFVAKGLNQHPFYK
ncbi:MAG: 4-(cytidine 5'-diphospho)-2-C-methyl-D-erythritol kinase [Methylotenera sp.]|uniref:4-(cytidine 5'-diphospho)-2-C-methyl-D-erythritol kinase n=1 Tax=Methylotenera sp. TaxID=2051956 RepID=UPI00271AA76C|nr:4-(cytidine 5'-diphospho)-2-C-methyl-D-erythritol kinase [Methylotenera sp.]MDO9150417.1 4-(cytidine 5'-diphospho)-2-C-methyl-D-erythritol kinase [Methylotenera sp.]